MKRDDELIRTILLSIERTPPGTLWRNNNDDVQDHDAATTTGHVALLEDAGFVAGVQSTRNATMVTRLTFEGHNYLDNIRDPARCKKTRAVAAKVGGVGLNVMTQIAAGIAIKAATGEIDGMTS